MTIHTPNGHQSRQPPPMSAILRACAELVDAAIGASGRDCGYVLMLTERQKGVLIDCHVVSDMTPDVAAKLVRIALDRMDIESGKTVQEDKP